jgi:hypothetical protein
MKQNDGTEELKELVCRRDNEAEINTFGKILLFPIKNIMLIGILLKKYIGDYITRPHDMGKAEFISFHATAATYMLLIVIMIFVEPLYLLLFYIGLIVFGSYARQ